MNKSRLKRKDLLYPELSYKIIGVLFEVFNNLGYRYKEKYYQKAIKQMFLNLDIPFKEQTRIPVEFKRNIIGWHIYDFIVDQKIILEIKRGDKFSIADIHQLLGYLKQSRLNLGILARFSTNGLKFKRIVNIKNS